MNVPEDCRFQKSHEWHRLEGTIVTIGITQHAADELTDITYVELPEAGTRIEAGRSFGEIESVKATADLYSGVTGTITEINTKLEDEPELINNDPFGAGWMLRVEVADRSEYESLLSAAAYVKATLG